MVLYNYGSKIDFRIHWFFPLYFFSPNSLLILIAIFSYFFAFFSNLSFSNLSLFSLPALSRLLHPVLPRVLGPASRVGSGVLPDVRYDTRRRTDRPRRSATWRRDGQPAAGDAAAVVARVGRDGDDDDDGRQGQHEQQVRVHWRATVRVHWRTTALFSLCVTPGSNYAANINNFVHLNFFYFFYIFHRIFEKPVL